METVGQGKRSLRTLDYLLAVFGGSRWCTSLNLEDFPFDSQRLQIILVRSGNMGTVPNYAISRDSGLAHHLKIPDWEVTDWKVEPQDIPIGREGNTGEAVVLSVEIKRNISFFTNQMYEFNYSNRNESIGSSLLAFQAG